MTLCAHTLWGGADRGKMEQKNSKTALKSAKLFKLLKNGSKLLKINQVLINSLPDPKALFKDMNENIKLIKDLN